VDFGNVVFPASVEVPRPTVIGQFSDYQVDRVSSGNVIVHDVNSINVTAFTCQCSQSPGTHRSIGRYRRSKRRKSLTSSNVIANLLYVYFRLRMVHCLSKSGEN